MIKADMSFEGFEAHYRRLDDMPRRVRTRIIRKMLGKASVEMRKRLKASAPRWHTGNLRRSLQRKVSARSHVRESFADVWFTAPHAHLVEAGTKERAYQTKTGKMKSTGRMPASRFATQAFAKARLTLITMMAQVFKEETERMGGGR